MSTYPDDIAMPVGFFPESLEVVGGFAYVASMTTGDIRKVNLADGTSEVFSAGNGKRATTGLTVDRQGRMFVCGGPTGVLWVLDEADGSTIASYQLGGENVFANDVLITPEAAFVTDSFSPFLYKIPFGPYGKLPSADAVEALPITGDFVYQSLDEYGGAFNSNGLVMTPDRSAILVVQTNSGKIFRIDPASGASVEVRIEGGDVLWGDGMLLEGHTLHVVQNLANTVSVLDIDAAGRTGRVLDVRTSDTFDSPTAIARFGSRFFLTNARFGNPDPMNATFNIVAIPA